METGTNSADIENFFPSLVNAVAPDSQDLLKIVAVVVLLVRYEAQVYLLRRLAESAISTHRPQFRSLLPSVKGE